MLEFTRNWNIGGALALCLVGMSASGLLGACKSQKPTATPVQEEQAPQATSKTETPAEPEDPQAALRAQLSREALDALRPFDFQVGRFKGQASLVKAPQVEQLEPGKWALTGEYAPDGTVMECFIDTGITSMGEKMGWMLDVTIGQMESIAGYQTSVGETFLRQSKYAGLSQVAVYRFKDDPSTVGFYTLVSTHGDTWSMTCGADSPGYFKTLRAATEKLADSITVDPDENTWVPAEYSIYELKVGPRRIGLQEHYLFRFKNDESAEIVSVSMAAGVPNKNFQVRSQFHAKLFQKDKLSSAWVGSHANGAPEAEFAYKWDSSGKGIRVTQIKGKEEEARLEKVELPIWSEAQIKSCFRSVLAGKKKHCKHANGVLTGKTFSFSDSVVKLKDKKERLFRSTAKNMTADQWMDAKMDTTRSRIEFEVGGSTVMIEMNRIWPEVEAN